MARYRKKKIYRGQLRRYTRTRTMSSRGDVVYRSRFVPVGMPNKFLTKMRYYSQFSLNPAVGTVVAKEFRCNDLYDTDVSVGGQQPIPFDQFANFYRKFRVLGIKAQMRPVSIGTNDAPCAYGMAIQPYSGWLASLSRQSVLCGELTTRNYKQSFVTGDELNKGGHVWIKWSGKKYYGRSYMSDNDFTCSASASPVTTAILGCWSTGITDATDGGVMTFDCLIEYIVLCTDPQVNSIS